MEKEIKFLNIRVQEVVERLESLGARKVFDAERTITHFDTEKGEYAQECKRIKVTKEDGIKLTVTTDVGSGTTEEIKTKTGDAIYAILSELHLLPSSEVVARRVSYELGEVDFDIDFFPGIPPFLEIDTTHVENLNELKAQLGLSAEEQVVMGTPEIFAHYGKDYFREFKKA